MKLDIDTQEAGRIIFVYSQEHVSLIARWVTQLANFKKSNDGTLRFIGLGLVTSGQPSYDC